MKLQECKISTRSVSESTHHQEKINQYIKKEFANKSFIAFLKGLMCLKSDLNKKEDYEKTKKLFEACKKQDPNGNLGKRFSKEIVDDLDKKSKKYFIKNKLNLNDFKDLHGFCTDFTEDIFFSSENPNCVRSQLLKITNKIRCVPDAWFYDLEKNNIKIIEVSCSSRMNFSRVSKYGLLDDILFHINGCRIELYEDCINECSIVKHNPSLAFEWRYDCGIEYLDDLLNQKKSDAYYYREYIESIKIDSKYGKFEGVI